MVGELVVSIVLDGESASQTLPNNRNLSMLALGLGDVDIKFGHSILHAVHVGETVEESLSSNQLYLL